MAYVCAVVFTYAVTCVYVLIVPVAKIKNRELHWGYRRGKTIVIRGNTVVMAKTCCKITTVTMRTGTATMMG